MNHLHFDDNLSGMQQIADNTVDYCYTGLPFDTGRDYNVFLHANRGMLSNFRTAM